jgi:hypothetical protein
VIGLSDSGDGGRAVSPGLVEYVPFGESSTLFSFSVRSKDVPRPLVPFDSSRWLVKRLLTWDISWRSNVDETGLFPRLIAPAKLPVDAGATAAITSIPNFTRSAVVIPLFVLLSGGGADCREELVLVYASRESLGRVRSSLFAARARVNKDAELDREVWVHGRILF